MEPFFWFFLIILFFSYNYVDKKRGIGSAQSPRLSTQKVFHTVVHWICTLTFIELKSICFLQSWHYWSVLVSQCGMNHQKSYISLIFGTLPFVGFGGHGSYYEPNPRVISPMFIANEYTDNFLWMKVNLRCPSKAFISRISLCWRITPSVDMFGFCFINSFYFQFWMWVEDNTVLLWLWTMAAAILVFWVIPTEIQWEIQCAGKKDDPYQWPECW